MTDQSKPKPQQQNEPSAPAPAERHAPQKQQGRFPIVGIGASAGGLEALEQFFKAVPADTGLAFVVIVHLQSEQKSMMAELLGKHTSMAVVQAREGQRVEPDHVYVIPPGTKLTITDDHLHIEQREGAPPTPVDVFFRSLARARAENAICIILSGMGSDGVDGMREIKAELGMAMVQEPESAKFDSMPRLAIQTGLVDFVLPPAEMPGQLLEYVRHELPMESTAMAEKKLNQILQAKQKTMQKIFRLLREGTGQDFSGYKPSTLLRRLDRRLRVHQLDNLEEYVRYLQQNSYEAKILQKELLISVTSFFRDPEAFAVLKKKGLMPLLEAGENNTALRVWVPGCATGEEAYSLAILCREALEELGLEREVQIFATDIDQEAIEQARLCRYPEGIADHVEPGRLTRFFLHERGGYRVIKEVREMLVFARHDIVKAPPFTRIDLLSCRNLLIYLGGELQQKLLPLFHYSLKPGGLLFLGTAETVGKSGALFDPVDSKWRLYRRRQDGLRPEMTFPVSGASRQEPKKEQERLVQAAGLRQQHQDVKLSSEIQNILLRDLLPPLVVTNTQGEVLYIHGRTGNYLELAEGSARWNVLDMARQGLKIELTTAFWRAVRENEEVHRENLRVTFNGGFQHLTLRVRPLPATESRAGLVLISFTAIEPSASSSKPGEAKEEPTVESEARIRNLEEEINRREENLRIALEELESSNEELRSSNEEYQSTNEELQSTNEELESSREEMQSVNEELQTVNSEMQSKVGEVETAYQELENFLNTLDVPLLMLDRELRISRFNVPATRFVSLVQSDQGRPLGDLTIRLKEENLVADSLEVLRTMRHQEKEVQTTDGHWFLMRILPQLQEDHLRGVLIVFFDIHRQKKAVHEREAVQEVLTYARQIIDTVREPLLVLDRELRVQSANASFYRVFQAEPDRTEGRQLRELQEGQWDLPRLRQLLEEVLPMKNNFEDFEIEVEFPGLGRRRLLLNARRMLGGKVLGDRILLAMEDVTARGERG